MNQIIICNIHRQFPLSQGDSITDCGRDRVGGDNLLGNGYPKKIVELYDTLYPGHKITFINKGISGNRVVDLLARYDEEFKGLIAQEYLKTLK